MISHIFTITPYGYHGRTIEVEGSATTGLPSFNIVGMANKTVSEATERVRNAIKNSGLTFPSTKLTINLAPAELAKEGSFLDLPIALAILCLSGQLRIQDHAHKIFVGELSLDGHLRPVRGAINIVETAKKSGFTEVYLPTKNALQAAPIPGIKIFPVDHLRDLLLHLCHQASISPVPHPSVVKNTKTEVQDTLLENIYGQELAKRALAIAVAGRHNLLLSGPPGVGKTLLARAAAALLPDLTLDEQLVITKLHSIASPVSKIHTERPFRSPHHTTTLPALIGGGPKCTPGEVSLAHLGILFLDELPEYPRSHLEALREPLEDKTVSLTRATMRTTYPADFLLIATMNPCPCGYHGDPDHECKCSAHEIARYQSKLSGPLLDRIDMRITVENVKNFVHPASTPVNPALTTSVVKNTITEVTRLQHQRYHSPFLYNSNLSPNQVSQYLTLPPASASFLESAAERLKLSARSYYKILKVSRTIADYAGSPDILPSHIAEALTYR